MLVVVTGASVPTNGAQHDEFRVCLFHLLTRQSVVGVGAAVVVFMQGQKTQTHLDAWAEYYRLAHAIRPDVCLILTLPSVANNDLDVPALERHAKLVHPSAGDGTTVVDFRDLVAQVRAYDASLRERIDLQHALFPQQSVAATRSQHQHSNQTHTPQPQEVQRQRGEMDVIPEIPQQLHGGSVEGQLQQELEYLDGDRFRPVDEDEDALRFCSGFGGCIVAGSFDHLHSGHAMLLTAAAYASSSRILLAVADGDVLLGKKKYREFMQPWEERAAAAAAFLHIVSARKASAGNDDVGDGGDDGLKIVRLLDAWGPSVDTVEFGALVVTSETAHNGMIINGERVKRGLQPLALVMAPIVKRPPADIGSGEEAKISSTQKRQLRASSSASLS
eukprot:ANDGO_00922.mRNA.1 Phosphopantetheine adenylyltransferase